MNRQILILVVSLLVAVASTSATAQSSLNSDIQILQQRWAEIQYQSNGSKTRLQALEVLAATARKTTEQYANRAEPKIWEGIILSTQAGLGGGLKALKKVKRARDLFEQAIGIDETALGGSAHVSLGALYYQVPPWPIAFGNNRKAARHLERALAIDPANIDGNFFMAGYLEKSGEIERAIKVLKHALKAPPRPSRPIADAGRRAEIETALQRLRNAAIN